MTSGGPGLLRRLQLWVERLLGRDERSEIEREVDEEFRFHLDMKAAALMAEGMGPEAARSAAAQRFGDTEALRRVGARDLAATRRQARRASRMEWLVQDIRDGARQLARRPGFTLLAMGTLALGLSASTAVFTYVNAYNRPFPGADAGDLYQVFLSSADNPYGAVSYPDFRDLNAATDGRFQVAGAGLPQFAASARHETLTEVVFGEGVTGDYFPLLRVDMALGRGIAPDDDRPDAPATVVISNAYWVRRYGASEDVLGRTLLLNNEPYTIIGVAGRDFLGSSASFRPQVWLPFEQFKRVYWARSDMDSNRQASAVSPYLRLSPGTPPAQVREALSAIASSLDREAPLPNRERKLILEPATWINPATRAAEASTTRIMKLAAALLLLLACANVANLVLSSGTRRRREMALRSAMGASRVRLLRQLLTESLLLSGGAGVLALLAAGPMGKRLSSYFASPSVWGANVPREIAIDPRVMVFALATALLTGVVTGLLPALRVSGRSPAAALASGGLWTAGEAVRRRPRIPGARDLLVTVQIALSVVLIFLAGLVLRTLDSARKVDAGFDTSQTLASYISTSSMGIPVEQRHQFFGDMIRRFEEMPWVRGATVAETAPLTGHPAARLRSDDSSDLVRATVARVWPGYFDVMGMKILRGRALVPTDSGQAPGVVVVNEALSRRMVGEGTAVGHLLWWPGEGDTPDRSFEVVGVVKDARQTSFLADPEPVAYFSLLQQYSRPGNAFLVKVAGDPAASVDRMEQELHKVDPRIAIVNILPYSDVVRGFLYPRRMNAEMFSVIACLGLILAAAGVFGVLTLAVARRRREIGVRVAVGADRGSIIRMVVAKVSLPVVSGLLVGVAGALLVTRFTASLVWGISATDPVALGVGALVILGAVGLAVINPIYRALAVDPVVSLRVE